MTIHHRSGFRPSSRRARCPGPLAPGVAALLVACLLVSPVRAMEADGQDHYDRAVLSAIADDVLRRGDMAEAGP